MKKFTGLFLIVLFAISGIAITGCVAEETPLAYAERAYPNCDNFEVITHRLEAESQTEISMDCPAECNEAQSPEDCETVRISKTYKCIYGWGIISDTTCHENN